LTGEVIIGRDNGDEKTKTREREEKTKETTNAAH
jgi:hypothetical protein